MEKKQSNKEVKINIAKKEKKVKCFRVTDIQK